MLTSVVLALPVPPKMPTVAPLGTVRLTSSRFQASAVSWYLKYTWSKRMEPSSTFSAGSACSSVMRGFSSSTSAMRLPQAMARVSIISTTDTIISDISISLT